MSGVDVGGDPKKEMEQKQSNMLYNDVEWRVKKRNGTYSECTHKERARRVITSNVVPPLPQLNISNGENAQKPRGDWDVRERMKRSLAQIPIKTSS